MEPATPRRVAPSMSELTDAAEAVALLRGQPFHLVKIFIAGRASGPKPAVAFWTAIPDEWRIGLRPGCDTRWRYLDRVDRR